MTALAATDVTITLAAQNVDVMPGMKRVCLPTIAFGDGALTYPTGGVPLPVIGNFGMKRELQRLLIQQPVANGFFYKYDADNHKIKIYKNGYTTGAAVSDPEEAAGTAIGSTITHAGTPGGNAVYLKFDSCGNPYLCTNMATDGADTAIAFGTTASLILKHDADAASGGLAVYFVEAGAAGAQLVVNNTLTGANCFLYLSAVADAVSSTFDLGGLIEMPATDTPAAVSLPCLAIGE